MYLCFVIINTLTIYKSNELKNLFVQLLHLRNICGIYLKTDKKKKATNTPIHWCKSQKHSKRIKDLARHLCKMEETLTFAVQLKI